jgi:hypothetical protein
LFPDSARGFHPDLDMDAAKAPGSGFSSN